MNEAQQEDQHANDPLLDVQTLVNRIGQLSIGNALMEAELVATRAQRDKALSSLAMVTNGAGTKEQSASKH